MIRVSTLGSVSVRNSDGDIASSLVSQPKRLAVFIYLAVASEDSANISRDRLCGMFWADSDPDRANQSLSQALLHIRRSLGDEAVSGKGQAALRAGDVVGCDAVDFIRACRAKQYEKALGIYAGPFLEAFAPAASAEFEQWSETERSRLASMAADAARALRDSAAATGNAAEAARWAQRVVDLCDVSDAESARLIELLVAIGDRAGARRAYDALAERLREDHDLEPTAATRALIANLDAGAEVSAAVPVPDAKPGFQPPLPDASAAETSSTSRRSRYAGAIVTVASLALGLTFAALWGMGARRDSRAVATPVVTVERVSFPGGRAGFDDRLTTELFEKLRADDQLFTRRAAAGGSDVRRLHDYLLKTSVSELDGRATAVATLFNARTGITLHQVAVDASTPVDSIARAIVVSMRQALGRDVEQTELERRTKNPRARALFRDAYAQQVEADSLRSHKAFASAEFALQQADSLLALVPRSSAIEPDVLLARASVANDLMWVRFVAGRGPSLEARRAMTTGLRFAENAVRMDRENARALEAAGVFSYFLAVTTPVDSASGRTPMLERSLGYLNAAVNADKTRAYAWAMMSALLMSKRDYSRAYWAANRGRQFDVFQQYILDLDVRMFDAAFQVGDTAAARVACHDFQVDHGGGYFAARCRLQLLAWDPEPAAGADTLIAPLVNEANATPSERAELRVLAATYYAGHGRPDRAQVFASKSTAAPTSNDLQLLRATAWYHVACGDAASARTLIRRIAQMSPSVAEEVLESPEFAALRATAGN
jgi:DNA-binding SARP family transcriptional activator